MLISWRNMLKRTVINAQHRHTRQRRRQATPRDWSMERLENRLLLSAAPTDTSAEVGTFTAGDTDNSDDPNALLSEVTDGAEQGDTNSRPGQERVDDILKALSFVQTVGGNDSDTIVTDDSYSDSWVDDAGGTTTVTESSLSTLTYTQTCELDGSWTYNATFTSSYDNSESYVHPGPENSTEHTWGFYNYTVDAFGNDTSTTYTLVVNAADSYFQDRSDCVIDIGDDDSVSIDDFHEISQGTDEYSYDIEGTILSDSNGSNTSKILTGNSNGEDSYIRHGNYSWSLTIGDIQANLEALCARPSAPGRDGSSNVASPPPPSPATTGSACQPCSASGRSRGGARRGR